MRYHFCHAGETVFRYGDTGNNFYVILKGKVSVLVPKKKNQRTKSKTIKDADLQEPKSKKKSLSPISKKGSKFPTPKKSIK